MNQHDFITESTDRLKAVADAFVSTGLTIAGEFKQLATTPKLTTVANHLSKASAEELDEIISALGWSSEFANGTPAVKVSTTSVDLSQEDVRDVTITSDKTGETKTVSCVFLEYIGETENGFAFQMQNGKILTSHGDQLYVLDSYPNGLTEGDMLPFKPQSISANPNAVGYVTGAPNMSAYPKFQAIYKSNRKNKKRVRTQIAKYRNLGYKTEQINEFMKEDIKDAVGDIKLDVPSFE